MPTSIHKILLPILATGLVAQFTIAQAQNLKDFAAQRRSVREQQQQTEVQAVQTIETSPAPDSEQERIDAIRRAQPAVASVVISQDLPLLNLENGVTGQTSSQTVVGEGSAFFVSGDGLLMTNNHVVSDTQADYTVITTDGQKLPARVVRSDPADDVALLKVNRPNGPFLTLGDSTSLQLGQTAIAIGNALGEYSNTVSVGVVSGLQRSIQAQSDLGLTENISNLIQTDAAINLGNSGGPLLNLQGQVIGMDTAIAAEGQNIGFAIPSNTLNRVLRAYGG
jgi:S1-C subfamily serine protease